MRPLEWFNLAVIHGPLEFWLHDDFYDDNGAACQAITPAVTPERFPCPTLSECAPSLPRLLDFAVTRWLLRADVVAALQGHDRQRLATEIAQRFSHAQNPWFHDRLAQIAGDVLQCDAQVWFRQVMQMLPAEKRLRLLNVAHKCLPHSEGLELVKASIAELPSPKVAQWCLTLSHFREPSILDWIEGNVRDPLVSHWGDLAAASVFDWDRASKWLRAGRPLSLVALDAMAACHSPRPNQSWLIQKLQPRLKATAPLDAIAGGLREHAMRDRSPRVAQAVRYILAHLEVIVTLA